MSDDRPPSSRIGRLSRLGRLGGRVGGSYVKQKVKGLFQDPDKQRRALERLNIDNADQLVETLSTMKGAAMKLGQGMANVATGLDLPEEVTSRLAKLHKDAEPISFRVIQEDIEAQLERPLHVAFARFDPRPIGTASLGQAHAATLPDGREVVVKVLHRGIDGSVKSDLAALKALMLTGRFLRRNRGEVDAIFDEIRARLEEELDYLQEAANIHQYTQLLADHPDVRIPSVHPGWSTERVLTMDRLPGVGIERFLQDSTPQARQRAGLTIVKLLMTQIFRYRTLHADPHPGNYLFEPDGRVGLLDFGCIKRFDEYWIAHYARAGLAAVEGRKADCMQACRDLGALHGASPEAEELLWQMVSTLLHPMTQGRYTVGAHDDTVLERIAPIGHKLVRYPQVRAPRDLVYLHRALGGTYVLLRRLVVRGDFGAILREHAGYAIAHADGRA
jgi:predicted unusual protein kinase regulating ubiquinone biosynthesis (AarF/ABC1/UbiB family)